MESTKTYLEMAVKECATDIFLIAGRTVSFKRGDSLVSISEERLMPDDSAVLIREIYSMANRRFPEEQGVWDDDFSLSIPGLARFRVNAFRQRGSLAAVIRVVQFGIPDWKKLGIPEEIIKISGRSRGLVLVTGPAGSGKSTTLACIVDDINRTRNAHIITIEDPIEYLHRNVNSIVSQRELNTDTESYGTVQK